MEESSNRRRQQWSSSSGEISTDVGAEKHVYDGDANPSELPRNKTTSADFAGPVDRSLPVHAIGNVERPADTNPPSTRPAKEKKGRLNHHSIGFLGSKFFDEKLPLKKKLKLLKRSGAIQQDGTVKFKVPEDIKPERLDLGTTIVYSGATGEVTSDTTDIQDLPPLEIVMLIVGTRGDVQPFVAIGKKLQDYGHRVRLATHSPSKEFVLGAGLEFYPLGGDPKVLAAYMVKNKGFLPSVPSEVQIQRKQIKDIILSLLPACIESDPVSNIPFYVDAIIANPPAYGHTHVAEALDVPLHIFFTMPWTKKYLKLRPITYLSKSNSSPTDIPHGYIWSPHLVPKPKDWGPKIDVVGFCFLDLASNYVPPESLLKWLKDDQKPIYIGFGSLPLQDPTGMTKTIVQALERTGQRGIINKGWGGLGNKLLSVTEPKDFVYLLDNCPHDWLFARCAAVVHHGGAGTTAAGLRAGVKERAIELAKAMENEDGAMGAIKAFYKHIPRGRLRTESSKISRLKTKSKISRRPKTRFSLKCFCGQ
nr:sterol 3-beta-glucosyltransferase UGT80A2-like [Ipomoea batatas]